jgi:Asp-tRNA(Asn)/Glu-tRNA(Gln) amidotransferase A subunit family amidase
LDVIAGYDPDDPLTIHSNGKVPESYLDFLHTDMLDGKRIGVLRELSNSDVDPEILALFEQAINDLKSLGAKIVDPFFVQNFSELSKDQWCSEFKHDIEDFLAEHVKWDSLTFIEDIIESGKYSNFAEEDLKWFVENEGREIDQDIPCEGPYSDRKRIDFRNAIENAMDDYHVDAIIYPSWNFPPALTDKYEEDYKGDNSQIIAPHTGQPAFTIPMGFTSGDLPAGIQFLGRIFNEPILIEICYAYEQYTKHRQPPKLFPGINDINQNR